MIAQLPLPFAEPPEGNAAFVPSAGNALALAWLDSDWPDRRLLIAGAAGSGKSHLLRAWAAETGATLWPGAHLRWPVALPAGRPLAVDDADHAPEAALLHVVNAAHEARARLVMTSASAPPAWAIALPDLASRLLATLTVRLGAEDDAALADLFARLLGERQLTIPPPLQTWMRLRLPRTPAALREAARRLDAALLAAGGRATRELATQVVEAVRSVAS